jgi:hypothetical protein
MAKDARGHGSDAHSSGVQEVGKPVTLHWEKNAAGSHVLLPESGSYPAVATISNYKNPDYSGSVPQPKYQATLHQTFNTGAARAGNWALHGSVQGAKNWVKRTVQNSAIAPEIRE